MKPLSGGPHIPPPIEHTKVTLKAACGWCGKINYGWITDHEEDCPVPFDEAKTLRLVR